ncbi:RNA-binding protein [Gracilaria domingensis]|nr:RNA-binding protein [Gracilaria domingensis]
MNDTSGDIRKPTLAERKRKKAHTYDHFKTPKRQKIDLSKETKYPAQSDQPGNGAKHFSPSEHENQESGVQHLTLAADRSEENDYGQSRHTRTLFVGNVDKSATGKDIKKLFKRFGPIESVRIRGVISQGRKIPKKAAFITGRVSEKVDSFRAYIVFHPHPELLKTMENACKEMNMTVFKDKHIRVMPAAVQRIGKQRMSLFVGNLPFDCAEEELIEVFQPIAEENNIRLVGARCNRDTDTGACRGVGFVSFDDILGIRAALNKVGELKIRGRVLRMEQADKMKDKKSKVYKRYKDDVVNGRRPFRGRPQRR